MEFNDIKITGLDADLTRPSDRGSAMRQMHLTLNETPTSEWVQCFEANRRYPRHSAWRHAWISGSHIVIDCVPEEIEKDHLKDLKEDVANSNRDYRAYLIKVAAKERMEQERAATEKKRLDGLGGRLNFD
jgi:hypothetical protein